MTCTRAEAVCRLEKRLWINNTLNIVAAAKGSETGLGVEELEAIMRCLG